MGEEELDEFFGEGLVARGLAFDEGDGAGELDAVAGEDGGGEGVRIGVTTGIHGGDSVIFSGAARRKKLGERLKWGCFCGAKRLGVLAEKGVRGCGGRR